MVKAVVSGVVLGFALVGVVATGMAWCDNQDFVTSSADPRTYNYIMLLREPGYYHIMVYRAPLGQWKVKINRMDSDSEPYNEHDEMTPGARL